ncbi:YdcF family protein [Neobacillus cucumis]|uniref:YdcF family protein n=1 Tax=Neobacillus cucumis TaxID=1740721 RepID=UPI002853724F|nr:YdcF family protein [Neobacillus cucumis]MDR4949919.1 YdcF family protein [Neobacillus cucumis]
MYFVKSIYFSINQKPVKSDVIIVLSGEVGRLETAYDLYKSGYADTIMLSNSTSRIFKSEIKKLKIPDNFPFIDEPNATSTYTNAKYTLALMKKHHFTSAIVVSSNYHMDRVRLAYNRALGNQKVKLVYVASYGSSLNSPPPTKKRMKLVLEEPIKYLGYLLLLYYWIDL